MECLDFSDENYPRFCRRWEEARIAQKFGGVQVMLRSPPFALSELQP
jgi:hypothetical protein